MTNIAVKLYVLHISCVLPERLFEQTDSYKYTGYSGFGSGSRVLQWNRMMGENFNVESKPQVATAATMGQLEPRIWGKPFLHPSEVLHITS